MTTTIANQCVICGQEIPEGDHVCKNCIEGSTPHRIYECNYEEEVVEYSPETLNDVRDIKKIEYPTVIAVDFDGTLCEIKYPEIGSPKKEIIDYIKMKKSEGCQIILWTNREGKLLDDALEWCTSYGLEFDAINEDVPWRTELYGNDCRKIGADIYIDDKSIHPNQIIAEMNKV